MKAHFIIYIFTALVIFSCNTEHSDGIPLSTDPLDTIKSKPAGIVAEPLLLENVFIQGTSLKQNKVDVSFYGVTIGKLKITSGYIVACDPGHIDEYGIPFTQKFPLGEFPVQLAIAIADNEERVAFARINFSDEPVAKWDLALQKGQKPIPVGDEDIHGYSVDLGVGIFADHEASKAIDKSNMTDSDDTLYNAMNRHSRINWRYAMHEFGNYNMAAFTSGFGDGYYASYIGFDAQGRPCRLLTDFNLIDWRKN